MMTLKDLTRPDGSSVPGIAQEQTEAFLKDYSQLGDPVADPVIEAMNGRCDGDCWIPSTFWPLRGMKPANSSYNMQNMFLNGSTSVLLI